jgi:isopentenyl-diphosphate delta-isomerase
VRGVEHVILVDSDDRELGQAEKIEAHQKGLLHRAFSIFLFDNEGRMLLQKRASSKYHTGGLWTNACCSHPRPHEPIQNTLDFKLMQEMGISCEVQKAFNFLYKAELDNGLTEYELDHVYFGTFSGKPKPNPEEVEDWAYRHIEDIKTDLARNPHRYTPWFQMLFIPILAHLGQA